MIKEDNLISCFDINVGRNLNTLKKYRETFKNRVFLFSSRLFTTVGTMPRLINLASFLGAKEIKFVGMDGHPRQHFSEGRSYSSFEGGWKKIPPGQTYNAQNREYLLFWEYMKKTYPKTIFSNLGEIYEHNVTKDILRIL